MQPEVNIRILTITEWSTKNVSYLLGHDRSKTHTALILKKCVTTILIMKTDISIEIKFGICIFIGQVFYFFWSLSEDVKVSCLGRSGEQNAPY